MDNNKKIRLIQVAKEFKVGFNTIADFLQKKGIQSDGSPSSLVSPEVYAILEKEFGKNRISGNERNAIRERISQKPASVSINSQQPKAKDEEELVVKSNVINVKDEIQTPKILGKIDLSAGKGGKIVAKTQPAAETKPESAPAVEAPKPQPAAAAAAAAPAPQAEQKPQSAPAAAQPSQTHVAQQAEPAKEEPAEKPKDNIFRPGMTQLRGPQIIGTMDVSNMVPGGKHKRKRLDKEKVDVNKAQHNGKGKDQGGNRGNNNNNNNNNNNGGGKGQQQNQRPQGEGKKFKNKKNQPKPVVRPEVSDEEVQKQIKDTLARLTSKGAKSKGAKYRKEKREEVREKMNEEMEREQMERSVLRVTEFVTVSELATMMN
ncbi:MAG: translation initiation factor IF-2, partial [Alistipes sp.]|nr:translation initiation factor IF-2 [Alistipes sp.]